MSVELLCITKWGEIFLELGWIRALANGVWGESRVTAG